MISTEVLSEVLGFEVSHCQMRGNNEVSIFKGGRTSASQFINIYELAHKCKEWAMPMYLVSGYDNNFFCSINKGWSDEVTPSTFYGNTEPEAIFKACQWILDNKEQQ